MDKNEVTELMNYILSIYPTTFKFDDETVRYWFNELQQYDLEDVKTSLKPLMKKEFPPKLVDITSGLRRKYEKTDWSKVQTLCQICHKPLSLEEYEEHYDRCLNIEFIIKKAKKWANKNLTRKELWALSDEAFEKKNNEILHYIYDHTQDESEKTRIGFIFNPPSKERAKSFLGVSE